MTKTDKWVLEWSRSTNDLHIQELHNLCAKNQQAFINDRPTWDYIVLMVGEKEAVHTMADSWRERVNERDRVRNQPRIRATS